MTNPSQPPDLSRVAAFTLSDVKRGLRWRVLRWLGQVRLEHVVLAWPYGVMSACLADYGFPSARQWFFLVVALASARGFVAAFDRLTSPNAPSSSRRSRRHHSHTRGHDGLGMLLLALSTGVLFLVSCGSLNRLALALSPFALAGLLVGWHLRGRGWLGHFAWGASLGIVPKPGLRYPFNLSVRKQGDDAWVLWRGTGNCTWYLPEAGFVRFVR